MNIATTNKNNIDIDPSKMVLVKKITSQVPTSFIGSSVHIVNILFWLYYCYFYHKYDQSYFKITLLLHQHPHLLTYRMIATVFHPSMIIIHLCLI